MPQECRCKRRIPQIVATRPRAQRDLPCGMRPVRKCTRACRAQQLSHDSSNRANQFRTELIDGRLDSSTGPALDSHGKYILQSHQETPSVFRLALAEGVVPCLVKTAISPTFCFLLTTAKLFLCRIQHFRRSVFNRAWPIINNDHPEHRSKTTVAEPRLFLSALRSGCRTFPS